MMKQVTLPASLAIRLAPHQRCSVELLAEQEKISLGEAARELLDAGIQVKGIEVENRRIIRPGGAVVQTKPRGPEHACLKRCPI